MVASILIPIPRKTFPAMIANDLVGIQPMTGPSGSVFSLRTRYGISAHKASSFDGWLKTNGVENNRISVDRYIEELLED